MSNLNITNSINFSSLGKEAKQTLLDFCYPVGSYLFTENTTLFKSADDVANYYGGNWTQLSSKFLYATSDYNNVGIEAGEASHVLTTLEIPSHSHTYYWGGGSGGMAGPRDGYAGNKGSFSANVTSTGGGQAHNNMPPYRKVLMFRRLPD